MDLPAPTSVDCLGSLHPQALKGFHLFNQGEYWLAHEALESAWLAETGQVRHLYRGILQASVAYLHIQRRNYRGALKVYHRSQRWLVPFPEVCRGVQVGRLRSELEAAIAEVRRLGPERLAEFDPSLLRPLVWTEED